MATKKSQSLFSKVSLWLSKLYLKLPDKLKDKIFEFLLVFLAVFLGFWADSWREKLGDNERERQYIFSMYHDLKSDTADFNLNLKKTNDVMMSMHKIVILLNSSSRYDSALSIYRYARAITYNAPFYQPNQRTYEQMKYSGDLRLIRNSSISDSVTNYYNSLTWILTQNYYIRQRLGDYMGAAESVFDGNSFMAILENKTDEELLNIIPASKYVTDDSLLFNKLYVRTQYFYGACKVTATAANDALLKSKNLLQLLKKKYDIEDKE